MTGIKIGAAIFRTGNSLEFAAVSAHGRLTAMNEEPHTASEREPRWTDGIWICHPVYLRVMSRIVTSVLLWAGTFIMTDVMHFCSLGFKRAEALAPFVVATLAALCVLLSRKYRWGLLRAFLLVAVYLFGISPAYNYWIHGPRRSHFPPVPEPPDFDYADVPTEINPAPKTK